MSSQLEEIYSACQKEFPKSRVKAVQKFLILAKQQIPDVKMSDCAKVAGYLTPNQRQNFRNSIVTPVRNFIGQSKFSVDEDALKKMFGKGHELSDEEKEMKKQILSMLPARSREVASSKNMEHLASLLSPAEDSDEGQ